MFATNGTVHGTKPTLPEEAFVLHGGCGCNAIRYRVSVPVLKDRPHVPYDITYDPKSGQEPRHRLPFTCVDHCNDCRTHSGSLVNYWMIVQVAWVEISCADAGAPPRRATGILQDVVYEDPKKKEEEEKARTWFPAADALGSAPALHYGKSPFPYLSLWGSTEGSSRSFCNRCGTSLTYLAHKALPEGWTPIMDFHMGTLDREDLEKHGGLMPTIHLWSDLGVDWVKKMAMGQTEVQSCGSWMINGP